MTFNLPYEDREDITNLLHGYAWHFDQNEPDAVAQLFTEDAVIDYGPEMANIVGRDTIAPAIRPGLSNLFSSSVHYITNIMLRPDGADTVMGIAYIYAWHTYHGGDEPGEMWGQYHCRFRRTDQGWRIARMVLKVEGMKNFHRSVMHPTGRRP